MDYQRLVSYIYSYPEGVKGRNVGFAKALVHQGQFKLNISLRGFWIWCLLYSIEENGKGQWENGIWFGNTSKRCRRLHSDRTWGIYTGNGSNIILS